MLSCVSAAAATDGGGGQAAREFAAGRLAESAAHRRASVASSCLYRGGRVLEPQLRTLSSHHLMVGQFRRGPTTLTAQPLKGATLHRFKGRLRTPRSTQVLSNFTVTPRPRPCIMSCVLPAVPVWRSGVGRRGVRSVRVLYIFLYL